MKDKNLVIRRISVHGHNFEIRRKRKENENEYEQKYLE